MTMTTDCADGVRTTAPQVSRQAAFLQAQRAIGKADATLRNYAGDLRLFARWLDSHGLSADAITREQLAEYVCELRECYSGDSLNGRLGTLRVFFRWLCDMGFRTDNPTIGLCRFVKAAIPPVRSLTLDEVRTILEVTRNLGRQRFGIHRGGFLVVFLLETGVRLGEALRLTLADLNLTDSRITVNATKTHRIRVIPITPSLRPRLAAYLQRRTAYLRYKDITDTGRLFVSEQGAPWSEHSAENGCRTIFNRAGLGRRCYPHLCRHTWATLSLASGKAPLPAVMAAGGWTRLETVKRYTQMSDDQIAEVAAMSSPLTQAGEGQAPIPADQGGLDQQAMLAAIDALRVIVAQMRGARRRAEGGA